MIKMSYLSNEVTATVNEEITEENKTRLGAHPRVLWTGGE
jgi:hypothetical protein